MKILQLNNISKRYPGVLALEEVSFDLYPGEIHAVLGENGAGKSTLIKIISGAIQSDQGEIILEGSQVRFSGPKDAQNLGISAAFQEEALFLELSVAENIYMNDLPSHFGLINRSLLYHNAQKFLQSLGLNLDPALKTKYLTIAQRQLIQVARAILVSAKILIFDEPATALTPMEREVLLSMMNRLREKGTGIIFITHHLEESLKLADRITILRDGKKIITCPCTGLVESQVIQLMVGRDIQDVYPYKLAPQQSVMLSTSMLTGKSFFKDVSFQVNKGEVLGIAGLTGCGKSELALALFGLMPVIAGTIRVDNRIVHLKSPKNAIDLGIFLVPQNRSQALFMSKSIRENMSLPSLTTFSRIGVLKRPDEIKSANQVSQLLKVKSDSVENEVHALSGGNRQKVLIGRAHLTNPRVFILVEPTLGIDVGAKREIYQTIHRLAQEGRSIILISSDISEIMGVSHRILVMHEGEITGELTGEQVTKDSIIAHMTSKQASSNKYSMKG